MHWCPLCGDEPTGHAWAARPSSDDCPDDERDADGNCPDKRDGDTRAMDDLEAQAAAAGGVLATLLLIMRDRIRIQRDAVRTIESGVSEAVADVSRAVIASIRETPGDTISERAERAGLDEQSVGAAIEDALAGTIQKTEDALVDLAEKADEQAAAGTGGAKPKSPRLERIAKAIRRLDEDYWRRRVIEPAASRVLEGVLSEVVGDDLEAVAERIERSTGAGVSSGTTEARTRIAETDRRVTAQAAEDAGAELFAYLGPADLITRPFCSVLVNHVYTKEMVGALDNAQTVVSPIISGGGYNCRHNWAPIDEVTAEVLGLPMGTMDMVREANARARSRR